MLTDRWTKRFVPSVGAVLMAVVVGCGEETSSTQLRLLDLTGRHVEPLQATHSIATVFLFTGSDCPISNRYAPEVRRLHEKFASNDIAFWLVYPDPDEPLEAIRKHIKEYQYHLGVLRDPQHTLVKMTGVRVTPEAAVFVRRGSGAQMVYRGRIDDRYVDFGRTRPAPTVHDLERVLDAVVEGRPIKSNTTPAVGCIIPDLK